MKKDILFLDANILFSAAYREYSGILKLWQLKSVKLISSTYAIDEARRNLDKKEQKDCLKKLLAYIEEHPYLHDGIKLPENTIIVDKDKPILLAAIATGATYLITGDVKDFGKFYGKKIGGVIILPPSVYLKNYEPG